MDSIVRSTRPDTHLPVLCNAAVAFNRPASIKVSRNAHP